MHFRVQWEDRDDPMPTEHSLDAIRHLWGIDADVLTSLAIGDSIYLEDQSGRYSITRLAPVGPIAGTW